MKKYLISYANKEFEKRQNELVLSAQEFGFNGTFSFTREWLETTEFYKENKEILNKQKGAGYWVWKPYVILEAMNRIDEGDVLIYCDAGGGIISNIRPLVDLCVYQGGILLFNGVNKNKFWTKRDCFVEMKCDSEEYWNASQAMGGYQVYVKNKKSLEFLKEDLKWVQISHLVDDSPSKEPNFEGFFENRHDQSILSILAVKYGIKKFRNPSQGGNHLKKPELRVKGELLNHPYLDMPDMDSDYPQIFFNKRNASNFRLFLIKLKNKLKWLI